MKVALTAIARHENKYIKEWIDFYQSYVKTYLERDVNKIIKVKNHLTFVKFMTSVAARTGQVLNYASIANEVGVSEVIYKEKYHRTDISNITETIFKKCGINYHKIGENKNETKDKGI